jgi:hypothetical protein
VGKAARADEGLSSILAAPVKYLLDHNQAACLSSRPCRLLLPHGSRILNSTMTDDQFTRLFERVEDGFAAMEKRFDEAATKDQVNAVYDLLDKNIKDHEAQEVERAAMNNQLNRHEKWLHQLSAKIGIGRKSAAAAARGLGVQPQQ